MSYQEELNKFFKLRAESFKKEGITIDKDKKIGYLYQFIQCFFNSLPKDAKWVEKWKGDINESDFMLAESTGAIILGFSTQIENSVKKLPSKI